MIFLPFKETPQGTFGNQYDPERINFIRNLPGFLGFYGSKITRIAIDQNGVCRSIQHPTLIRFDNDKNRMFAKLSV